MAGIYARIGGSPEGREDSPLNFAILTTKANDAVSHIHHRMSVLLTGKSWLPPQGIPCFQPFPAELMTAYPVTPKMNRASYNVPDAIKPLGVAIA
jgi:putative SOS response-associated peptidase YedK